MFSTPGSLKKRTGKSDLDRYSYLKQLIEEYNSEQVDEDKKEQVLANLANFAYDPINYEYFRRLNVIDLFLNNLKQFHNKEKTQNFNLNLLNFSIAGICNLCLDEKNYNYLIKNDLINLILNCLSIEINLNNIEIILNILTTLIFLIENEQVKNDEGQSIKQSIVNFNNDRLNFKYYISELSKSENKRISNLASVLLTHF